MSERPVMYRIEEARKEAREIKTFFFRGNISAAPGQFVMLWVPGAGQRPFGISYQEDDRFAVTVRKVGGVTERLFGMKKGERVGIQGPYGRAFSAEGQRVALVGGGYGTAPLALLADVLSESGRDVTFIIGAANRDFLLYGERFRESGVKTVYATDDGSFGHKGFCTECLKEMLTGRAVDYVYCCGPEMMMAEVFRMCTDAGVPAEFSLERYIKCGFGVCGSCVLDPTGWRVCKEGPVFTSEELKKVTEFGRYKRNGSGKREEL